MGEEMSAYYFLEAITFLDALESNFSISFSPHFKEFIHSLSEFYIFHIILIIFKFLFQLFYLHFQIFYFLLIFCPYLSDLSFVIIILSSLSQHPFLNLLIHDTIIIHNTFITLFIFL